MIWILLLALSRPYHVGTVASLATSRHTHVQVEGRVTLVRHEPDGDWHIRISDGQRFIIAEIIPTFVHLLMPPRVGQCVRVRGIRRFDNEARHGWAECHPVEFLEVIPCHP